jgi:hypothetical protein
MMTDPKPDNGENDPKKLWQNQPREETTMTLKMIHKNAEKLRARNPRELFGNIATIPLAIAISWFGFLHTHDLEFRSVFVASVAWAVLGQYLVHRGMWSATPSERSALMTGLEFYRHEIDRRRNLLGRFLQWALGPVVLCMGALILLLTGMARSVGKPGAALPFTTLGVIWLIAVFVLRSRHQRELRQEIDLLNEIEKMGR